MGRGKPDAFSLTAPDGSIDTTHESREQAQSTSTPTTLASAPGNDDAILRRGRDDDGALFGRAQHDRGQLRFVIGVGCAETQIDQRRLLRGRPADRLDQRASRRRERVMEHLHRKKRRVRRLLANRRGHGGSMPEPIGDVATDAAIVVKCDGTGDALDVRVRRVDAAVNDGNPHALPVRPAAASGVRR